MVYIPKKAPPLGLDARLLNAFGAHVESEYAAIAREFMETTSLDLRAIHAAPLRPRVGMIAYADGSDWDPGDGEGAYEYSSSGWRKLHEGSSGIGSVNVSFTGIAAVTINAAYDSFRTAGYSNLLSSGAAIVRRSASEPTHEGKIQDASGQWWEISPYQAINIKQFGATVSASDCLAEIQNCVEYCAAYNVATFIPAETFTVSDSILYDAGNRFIAMGNGSKITGNFADYIFDRSGNDGTTPLCNTEFRGLAIQNTNGAGSGIWIARGIGFQVELCDIRARLFGIYVDYQAFNITIKTCTIVHQQQNQSAGSIGILSHHHTAIINCDITHWETAVRKWSQSGLIMGGRFEVNKTGVMLGRDIDNAPSWARGTMVCGVAFEACDTAIVIRQGEGISVLGNVIQGTTGSPSGGSLDGIVLTQANGCIIAGNAISGSGGFSGAGIRATQALDSTVIIGNWVENNGSGSDFDLGAYTHDDCMFQTNEGQKSSYGSQRCIHSGNKPPATSTSGTDTTPVTTETYLCEIEIDRPCNVNGIAILNGSAVAGNVTVCLYDRETVPIAAAVSASTAQSGTNAYQKISFTAAYQIKNPGKYFVAVQFNNTGARFRTHDLGVFATEKITGGTYGTFVTGANGTTFTTGIGPIASLF